MAGMTLLASGYQAVEAPAVDAAGGLYFSDTYGGGVYYLGPDGTLDVCIPRRKGAGGIVLHADGGIVVSGRDVSHVRDAVSRVLLTREDVPARAGTRVGGFNDTTADRAGRVFTGSTRFDADSGEPAPGELLMLTGPGEVTVVYGDVGMTNGIAQSADGTRLYHADTARRRVIISEMAADDAVPVAVGELTTAIDGRPDGLACDVDGGVWVAWGSRVLRFDAGGGVDGSLELPAEHVLNCCFAGEDLTDMIVVTMDNTEDPSLGGCVWRLPAVGARGVPVAPARI